MKAKIFAFLLIALAFTVHALVAGKPNCKTDDDCEKDEFCYTSFTMADGTKETLCLKKNK
ncbi:hypothetical protein C0J52_13255 [Blattella germanica]|nr:hypothetical protein C0J52_13255 [Blattella germanica]